MFYKFLKVVFLIFLIVLATVFYITLTTLAPFPLNQANIILLIITFLILFARLPLILWFTFLVSFILEFYSLFPFGSTMFSLLFATIIAFFVFQRFLTNFSFLSMLVVLFTLLLFNKIIFLFLQLIFTHSLNFSMSKISNFFWEFLITACFLAIVYFFVRHFYKLARPEYVVRQ